MFYRILWAPPGYVHPKNYMLAKYRTLDYDSRIAQVKSADDSPFFATVDEARCPLMQSVFDLNPIISFLELWESSETS